MEEIQLLSPETKIILSILVIIFYYKIGLWKNIFGRKHYFSFINTSPFKRKKAGKKKIIDHL